MAGEPGDGSIWWTLPLEIRNIIYKFAYVSNRDLMVKGLLAPVEYQKQQRLAEIEARRSGHSVCEYSHRSTNRSSCLYSLVFYHLSLHRSCKVSWSTDCGLLRLTMRSLAQPRSRAIFNIP